MSISDTNDQDKETDSVGPNNLKRSMVDINTEAMADRFTLIVAAMRYPYNSAEKRISVPVPVPVTSESTLA